MNVSSWSRTGPSPTVCERPERGRQRGGRVYPLAAVHEPGDEFMGAEIAVTAAHADRAVTRLFR